ncbi:MAG: MFS transporter [Armatimonadetes bacterium]|nr:MFS transporter [Armatimonadota bacterium]MDE2207027.1 MFS transporter [Armatimonadota bacterium]
MTASDATSRDGQAVPQVSLTKLLTGVVIVAGFAELAYIIVNLSAMPVYIRALGLGRSWVGIVGTVYLLTEASLKSPFGVLGDRVGRKFLILAGPVISIFTAALTPFVANPYGLVLLRIADGMGAAALWPSCFSVIGDFVPEARRGAAMSMFNLAYIMGIALGPAIGGNVDDWAQVHFHLSAAASKNASFFVASALFAVTAIAVLALIPRQPHYGSRPADAGEAAFSLRDFRTMLSRIPANLALAFVTFLGIGLVMLYVKIYAMEPGGPFHMTERLFGNLMVVPALVIALLSVPLGSLGDRVGKAIAVRCGVGLCVIAFWLLMLFPSRYMLVICGAAIGLGFVVAFPAWMAIVSALCHERQRGAANGAVGTAQGLGAIIGAAASVPLYSLGAFHVGHLTVPAHVVPFIGCGVILTGAFFIALFAIHDRPASRPVTS